MKLMMKMRHILWALILSLVLLMIPAYSVEASGLPTISSIYVMSFSHIVPAGGNNGTTTSVNITGTNLTGVTGVAFLQGTVQDPLISIANITANTDTGFNVQVLVAAGAAAGARNVTVTTPSGTSLAFASGFTVYRAAISVTAPGVVTPGSTFNVTINVNNVANLNTFQFDLNFDNNRTTPNVIQVNGIENLTGVTDGLIHDITLGDKDLPYDGWTFQPVQGIPSGTIRVIGSFGNANKCATGSGSLAQISFMVTGAAGTGTNITLSGVGIFNRDATSILPDTTTNGAISVVQLSIVNTFLPEATVGVTYTAGLSAVNGTSPYHWSATGLPGGLNLNTDTGAISGTPNTAGTFPVNITVTDSKTPTPTSISKQLNLTVYPVLQITTSSLPDATQNVIYSGTTVIATGGKTPYIWSSTGLPAGLTIGTANGLISGTPAASGDFSVTISVTDSFSPHNTANTALALHVNPALQTTTNAATGVGATTATLNGILNYTGSASSVALSFEYWKGTDTPTSVTATPFTGTANNTAFSAGLSSLLPGTIYTFHAKAIGNGNTVIGNNLTFTTSTPSAVLRVLPVTVGKGQTFNVTVTFSAADDNVNAIGLSDFVPAGWTATVNNTWNTPPSDTNNVTANRTDYIWNGPFTRGTAFTAVYQVTVSANATPGVYNFSGGTLQYYVGSIGPTTINISGNSQVQVVNGAVIQGKTYESKGLILAGVTLTLDGTTQVVSAADGSYQLIAATTGSHTIVAAKTGYRSQTRTVNVTDLTATYTLDFKAGYSLVPNTPDMSYVLACINKWKYPPADGTGPDISKILSVINAWKYPVN